ncbi:MAG: hydroxyacid dehydrogenase [Treponemataceae bacterium]
MALKVLIPQDISEEGKQFLRDHGYEIKMGSGISVEAICADVVDCSAILARTAQFPAAVFRAGKQLKVIGRHGVGFDNIDVAVATELGIQVTYAPESNASSVSEHAIGLLVATARNYIRQDREFRAGNFEVRNQVKGVDLEGKTLAIIGAGRIGAIVARKALRGLDMKVIAYDPIVKSLPNLPEVEFVSSIEDAFKRADFVTLHLPSLPQTKGIVNKKLLALLKPTAYFINAARGELVVEEDLIAVLKDKKIAGAALDVFREEPPAKDNPLFALDNVILTPHSAALTKECTTRMALHAAMGIDDVLSGRAPKWPVNKLVKG